MNANSSDDNEKRRPQPGQETRIGGMPVAERINRAKRSGLGGNRTILVLGVVAILLLVVVAVVAISKLGGDDDSPPPPQIVESKTGTLQTLPVGASVLSGDSLIGTTPLTFTMTEGSVVRLMHPCCPDTQLVVDFARFESEPIVLQTSINIVSDPVGARIILNGEDINATTPYKFPVNAGDTITIDLEMRGKRPLNSGPIVLAEFADYQSTDFDLRELETGGLEFSGSFADRPRTRIISYPSGAEVTIQGSGVKAGTTPLNYDFGETSVQVTISKDGFEDRVLEIPVAGDRKPSYPVTLFRRVDLSAYDATNPEKSLKAKLTRIIYGGRDHGSSDVTPASVRLPGIECRLVFEADGYVETDTIITPYVKEFSVQMRPKTASQSGASSETVEQPAKDENSGSVRLVVVDNDRRPVEGAVVMAEFKLDGKDQYRNLGRTDSDGEIRVNLTPAKYKFIASHENYKNEDEKKEIKAGEEYIVTIKIKRR